MSNGLDAEATSTTYVGSIYLLYGTFFFCSFLLPPPHTEQATSPNPPNKTPHSSRLSTLSTTRPSSLGCFSQLFPPSPTNKRARTRPRTPQPLNPPPPPPQPSRPPVPINQDMLFSSRVGLAYLHPIKGLWSPAPPSPYDTPPPASWFAAELGKGAPSCSLVACAHNS